MDLAAAKMPEACSGVKTKNRRCGAYASARAPANTGPSANSQKLEIAYSAQAPGITDLGAGIGSNSRVGFGWIRSVVDDFLCYLSQVSWVFSKREIYFEDRSIEKCCLGFQSVEEEKETSFVLSEGFAFGLGSIGLNFLSSYHQSKQVHHQRSMPMDSFQVFFLDY